MAVFIKMDIFKKQLWYTYKDNSFKWFKLSLDQVNEMIALNKNNETVASLEEYELDIAEEVKIDFENVVGQESLTRFDKPKQKKSRKRNNRNKSKSTANSSDKKPFKKSKNRPTHQTENKNTPNEQKSKPRRNHKNKQRNEPRNDNKNEQK